MFENDYSNFLRTYHTMLRNIGLYISLSLATLAYSRFYRGKNTRNDFLYNIGILFIGIILLSISFSINYKLLQDIKMFNLSNVKDLEQYKTWFNLPYITIVIIFLLFGFNIFTLIRELMKK